MEPFAPWRRFYGDVKPHLEYPDCTIWEAVRRTAEKYPESTALIYLNRKVSYKEMIKRIEAVRWGFVKLGVKKGDRVLIALPNTLQAVYTLYGLSSLGAVACFVHPLASIGELDECLKITNADILVAFSSLEKALKGSSCIKGKSVVVTALCDEVAKFKFQLAGQSRSKRSYKRFCWSEIMTNSEKRERFCAQTDCNEPAVVLFSGGTSGKQKGALISSFALNAMATGTKEISGCEIAGKSMLAVMPLFHGFGLGVCVHTALMHGGCAILVPRFFAEKCGKNIKKYRPSFIAGVPAMLEALMKSKSLSKADLSFLAGVFSGGDTLQAELKSKLDGYLKERGAKIKVREGYGLTECIAVSCLAPCDLQKKGSIGIPLPDTYYKICKEGTTASLPAGEVGEICVTGPTLMLSYLGEEAETKRALRLHSDGRVWLHTGDAGLMDKDGFVYFKGRIKRMIVTNGYNVYPSQVERVLNSHSAVKLCCVVGVKDSCKSEKVKAFVVLRQDCDVSKAKQRLKAHCRRNLMPFEVPAEIELVRALPMTRLGKVDYRRLEAVKSRE